MNNMKDTLPDTWERVKLGDFVISEKGKKPKNQNAVADQRYKYPYIDIEAFEKNIIKSYADGENCRFCSENDFLMVWDGSRSGLVGKGMNGALGSTLVRINFPRINNDYAFYFLKSKFQEINTRAKGSGTPHVDPDLLWNYNFPVAPFKEQVRVVEKIEELFSELDKGIESLKTAKAQLAVYRQALLKHAFEGKLTEKWRASNADKLESPEQLLTRIQQEREARYQQHLDDWEKEIEEWEADGKEGKKPAKPKKLKVILDDKAYIEASVKLPFGWEYCSLGKLIDEPKYGTSKKCTYDEEGKGVLRIPNVANNIIDSSDLKYAKFDEHDVKDYQLNEGDIVIIRSNGSVSLVGKGALINSQDTRFLYAGYLIRLRANTQILYPKYLLYTLQSYPLRKQIEEKAKSTSGVNNINSGELQSLVISLPSLDEQKQVVLELENKISLYESTICDIEDKLKKSELLRQSILKKAFSGQLVPQNSDDEPASELLKKIAIEKTELAEKEKAEKAAARKAKTAAKKAKT